MSAKYQNINIIQYTCLNSGRQHTRKRGGIDSASECVRVCVTLGGSTLAKRRNRLSKCVCESACHSGGQGILEV